LCVSKINQSFGARKNMKRFISITIICTLISSVLFAQSPVLQNGIYTDLNGNPFTGNATIEDNTNQSTQKQYIEVKEGLLHGQIKFYHSKGYLEEVGQYNQGKKDGVWIQYASNGQKLGEAFYKEGQKDGIWTVWDEQGVKRYHMVYSMGKKIDTWKMWDSNSVLVSERIYNE
jgi:antitoxin component YwqK of YwqJK toxin-antitoxin module